MRAIWKFPLEITDRQFITVPSPYLYPLTVQMQGSKLCLWAEVNADVEYLKETFEIAIIGTGSQAGEVSGYIGDWLYIGTVQERIFVWHVYMKKHR